MLDECTEFNPNAERQEETMFFGKVFGLPPNFSFALAEGPNIAEVKGGLQEVVAKHFANTSPTDVAFFFQSDFSQSETTHWILIEGVWDDDMKLVQNGTVEEETAEDLIEAIAAYISHTFTKVIKPTRTAPARISVILRHSGEQLVQNWKIADPLGPLT